MVGNEVGALSVPSFGPVKRVVAATHHHHVADIYRAAEEFETVVRAFVGLTVVYDCTAAHTVERDSVGFMFLIESIAGVFYAHILQFAGVVGIVVAAINGTADFGTSFTSFGIGVCLAADVDTAPGTRFFLFAGHDDRSVCRTHGIDFGTLLYQDIIHYIVVDGYNLYACLNVQCGACFDDVLAAQFVRGARFQGYIRGNRSFQGFHFTVVVSAVVVIITARSEERHACHEGK